MNRIMAERLGFLLDAGSFSLVAGDEDGELIGGVGTIDGRSVCVLAINPEASVQFDPVEVLRQELATLDYAEEHRLPLIHLADRPGRIAMETTAIPSTIMRTFIDSNGAGRVFARFAQLSGVVPRIAVVFRPIATTLTYPVAECDSVIMVEGSGMSLARPDMVRLMTGDASPYEDYGGARMHATVSGTCDVLVPSEEEALRWVRNYLSFFPSHFEEFPPSACAKKPAGDMRPVAARIPADPDSPYDIYPMIAAVVDEGSLLELGESHAHEAITAFGRIGGMPVGIIASNPDCRGGILFPATCTKIAGFASLCDAFSIPLVFLADIPGFMVGKDAEQAGIIRHGALVFSVLANLSVPHMTVVVRKAYTAGLYAMGGPGFEADRFLAFPGAHITIYGRKAVSLLARKSGMSPEKCRKTEEHVREISSLEGYAASGYLDRVIAGNDLRDEIERFLKKYYGTAPGRLYPKRVLCI